MFTCPNPKCRCKTYKKYVNDDGSFYYRCSTCQYESLIIQPV